MHGKFIFVPFSGDSHCSFFTPVLSAPAWCPTKSGITWYAEQGGSVELFIHHCVLFAYISAKNRRLRKLRYTTGLALSHLLKHGRE